MTSILDIEPADFEAMLADASPEQRATLLLSARLAAAEDDPAAWLRIVFPTLVTHEFGDHHLDYWRWLWAIELDERPESFVGIWARGGAKSSSAEAGVAVVAARRTRQYALYVCETQDQADDHVGSIGSLLESPIVARAFPALARRAVGKYGNSKGWRRNRLRTAQGFTVDALGLDTAARGVKLELQRPDLLVLDDIDSERDGPGQVEKKVDAITRKLIPAGSSTVAVLAIQNLVNPQGVFAQLAGITDTPADFLLRRHVSGPIPALYDAAYDVQDGRTVITAGRPSWVGQDIETCQAQIDDMGPTAFRVEAQHETDARQGPIFGHLTYQHCRPEEVPPLRLVEVWVDPAVTDTDNSDSMAIQADGLADSGCIYRLRSWEKRSSPTDALKLALAWAVVLGARRVGVETDQGGDTWQSVYREALGTVQRDLRRFSNGEAIKGSAEYLAALGEITQLDSLGDDGMPTFWPFFDEDKAGSTKQAKAHRAQQMVPDYERPGRIIHVIGYHSVLEAALNRFMLRKPFDLADAAYWSWRALRRHGSKTQTSTKKVTSQALPAVPVGFGRAVTVPIGNTRGR